MKMVTFRRAVAPHSIGDQRLVPDHVAQTLFDAGELSNSVPFGPPEAPQPQQPRRPILRPQRPAGARDARIAK